jgi:hypothetical protein
MAPNQSLTLQPEPHTTHYLHNVKRRTSYSTSPMESQMRSENTKRYFHEEYALMTSTQIWHKRVNSADY